MQSSEGRDEEPIFVIEVCNCTKDDEKHTRVDKSKYDEYFNKVSSAIVQTVPNAIILRNQIPKSYLHHDLYCNLIPNEDANQPYFHQVPRTYAFEVSYQGHVSSSLCQNVAT